jgi:endonuclease G, mitochondrial
VKVYRFKTSLRHQISILALIPFFVAGSAGSSSAAITQWPSQYLNGVAPDIKNSKLAVKTRELGYDNFAVMHSGVTMSPLWSAEHLVRFNLLQARGLERRNSFHHEERLPAGERAELQDYAKSGFDRGHMAPNADMPTESAQRQCFTLANMIPQDPDNNRHLWEGIESSVRTMAKNNGDLYVITGPLYLGSNIQRLNGRVLVPTHMFKIVFDPQSNRGAAYFVKNEQGDEWQVVSISQLEKLSGINFFPKLSLAAKSVMLKLPDPTPYHSNY